MDKDLATIYAFITGFFGSLFGVEIGVFWFALAGAFFSLRFVETKETKKQMIHVAYSVLFTCMVVGGTHKVYPDWVSLRLVGCIYGLTILLLIEKCYVALRDTNITVKFNEILDKAIAKWIP